MDTATTLICDYCDQVATRHLIDGDEVLCRACAHSQFDVVTDWTRPLTAFKVAKITAHRDQA